MRELCERVGGVVNAITPLAKVPRTPPLFDNHDGLQCCTRDLPTWKRMLPLHGHTTTQPRHVPSPLPDMDSSYLCTASRRPAARSGVPHSVFGGVPDSTRPWFPPYQRMKRSSDPTGTRPYREVVCCAPYSQTQLAPAPQKARAPEASQYPRSARCDLPAGPGDQRIGSAACRHGYFRSRVIWPICS